MESEGRKIVDCVLGNVEDRLDVTPRCVRLKGVWENLWREKECFRYRKIQV